MPLPVLSAQPSVFHYHLVRGNRWLSQIFLLVRENFNWTGVVPLCLVRQFHSGPILATPSITSGLNADQAMQVQLSLTGAQTASFPLGPVYGDLKLYRESALFGPYTPISFIINVTAEITR